MDQEQPHQELVKCVVVGDTAVGKTRLICARACNKHVSLSQLLTTHVPTVWAIDQYRIYKDVLERSWEIVDGVNVSLRLWDTFGDHEKDRRFAYGSIHEHEYEHEASSARSYHTRVHDRRNQGERYDREDRKEQWEVRLFNGPTYNFMNIILEEKKSQHPETFCKNNKKRSDVVLLCFSVTSPVSLRNCAAMWYPEIRRFCPSTPVLLVGCKNDLRYMYRDETYLSFFRDHSPFVRATRKSDLVMPDEARAVARDLGVYYYETSVLTYHGVNEVFENAIRAALLARRNQRFWMTNLKRVQRPLLQEPFRPPRPLEPEVAVAASCYLENISALFTHQYYADMVIICGSKGFPVHRLMLAATSETFHRLLTADLAAACELARSSSESSMVSSMGEATAGEFNEDTEHLIRQEHSRHHSPRVWEHIKRRSSCQILPTSSCEGVKRPPDLYREVNHPAIQSIRVVQCERRRGAASTQTVVTMSKLVSQQVMLQLLTFFYSGIIDNAAFAQEIRQAAELLGCHELGKLMAAIQTQHHLLDADTMRLYHAPIAGRLGSLCVERALFADVTFELDDGLQAAHRALLVARCDPMRAMFQGHFRESTARVISLPGVDAYTFHKLLCYVYTDSIPGVEAAQCLSLLELANRLCMNRLVTLVEARVIEDLRRADQADAVDLCLSLLEPVKFHNAHGLAEWCLWRLCGAYDRVCRARALRQLHPDHRDYLSENRWPPVWYLKELDYYEKCFSEQVKESPPRPRAVAAAAASDRAGCLCFSSKARRESDDTTAATLFRSATSVDIPPSAPAPL